MGSPRRRLPGGSATTSLSSPSTKAASGARHGLPSNDKKFGVPDGILLTYQDKSALLLLIGACSKFLIPHSKEKGTLTKEQMGVPRPSVGSGSVTRPKTAAWPSRLRRLGPSGFDPFCNPIPRVKLQPPFFSFVQLLCSI